MSYSKLDIVKYTSGAEQDIGDGSPTTYDFKCWDATKKGLVLDVGVNVTETVAADTTAPQVQVGTSGDADAFAILNVPDTTAAAVVFNVVDDTDAIIDSFIPAGTTVRVTPVVGVDAGTEAGKGFPYVVVGWY